MARLLGTARAGAAWTACLAVSGALLGPASVARAQEVQQQQYQVLEPPVTPPAADLNLDDPNGIHGFQLVLGASINEILTDNARGVANSGAQVQAANGTVSTVAQGKTADLITQLTPTVSVFDVTRRIQAGLTLSPSFEKFLNATDQDRFDTALTATGSFAVIPDYVNLNATSSISRQTINQQGALQVPGVTQANNQTTVATYTISPSYTQPFGDFGTGRLNYLFGSTTSGVIAPAIQNQIGASLTSGTDFNRIQWTLSLVDSETTQGSQPNGGQVVNNVVNPVATGNTSQQTGEFDLNYALNRTVSLLSGFGYEHISNSSLAGGGGTESGKFYKFGVGLTGTRAKLNLLYNLRYNSDFLSLQGDWDITPRIHLQASYGESVQTEQSLLIQNAANIGLPGSLSSTFTNPATGQPFNPAVSPGGVNSGIGNAAFLDKSGQAVLTGTYDRDTWAVTALTDSQSSAAANFNQSTASLFGSYGRQLTPDTTLNVNLGLINQVSSSPTSRTDTTYNATASLSYALGDDLTALTELSFTYRNSSVAGQDLEVSTLTVGLRKTF